MAASLVSLSSRWYATARFARSRAWRYAPSSVDKSSRISVELSLIDALPIVMFGPVPTDQKTGIYQCRSVPFPVRHHPLAEVLDPEQKSFVDTRNAHFTGGAHDARPVVNSNSAGTLHLVRG